MGKKGEKSMALSIGGYIQTSFLDYPAHTAAVFFCTGCQFRCPFCHNPDLVLPGEGGASLSPDALLSDLESRKPFLDGVCVTGGEPTLQEELPDLLAAIRSLGLKVKLDTNGARPDVLKALLSDALLDYVAMDVKAPWCRYPLASGWKGDTGLIRESMDLLLASGIPFEFRTTLVPGIHSPGDAPLLGEMARGAPLFVLQSYRPGNTLSPAFAALPPLKEEFLTAFKEGLRPWVREVRIRG